MADGAPKSAYELAMEKLKRQDEAAGVEAVELTPAQIEAIAEARKTCEARVRRVPHPPPVGAGGRRRRRGPAGDRGEPPAGPGPFPPAIATSASSGSAAARRARRDRLQCPRVAGPFGCDCDGSTGCGAVLKEARALRLVLRDPRTPWYTRWFVTAAFAVRRQLQRLHSRIPADSARLRRALRHSVRVVDRDSGRAARDHGRLPDARVDPVSAVMNGPVLHTLSPPVSRSATRVRRPSPASAR